jgi:long-chain acyl-CoA synthetase
MNIYNYFNYSFLKNPDKIFIKTEKKKYTYRKINELINNLEANIFIGKYIVIIHPNCIFHFVLYILASKLNKTLVTLDHNSQLENTLNNIKKFKLNNIFCSKNLKKDIIKNKIKTNFIFQNKKKNNDKKFLNKNDIFLLTFTSGSTTSPKPIALSQKTKIDRAFSNIKLYNLNKKDNLIISTPLHHTLAIRLMTISIVLGTEITFLENYNLMSFLKIIKKNNCNFTFFVSNQLIEIIKKKSNLNYLKNFKSIVSSSSTLPNIERSKLLNFFSGDIFEMYGLSEAAIVSNLNLRKNKLHLNSVGKPIPHVKIKIKKFKNKNYGEILIKSKYMCLGYLKKNQLLKIKNNSFFETGDIGKIVNNYLYLIGRKKRMIKINGISIFLEDIEKTLIIKNFVKDCVAAPLYSKENINPRICILYEEKKLNINELKKKCFKTLPTYQLPTYYFKINNIPKNSMGKLDMKKIMDYINKVLFEY